MLQIVKKNFAKLSGYPRVRILLIIAGVIIIFVIIMNLLSSPSNKAPIPPSQVQAVSASPNATNAAPANQAAQYQQLASASTAANDQKTIQSGGSVMQNAVSPTDAQQPATPAPDSDTGSKSAAPNKELASQIAELQNQLAAQQQNQPPQSSQSQQMQQQQLAQQQEAQQQQTQQQQNMAAQMQNIQSAMRSGLENVTGSWQLPTLATVQGQAPAATDNNVTTINAPVAIQAGSILFGVIDTALDSDQPGTPGLATVVTGPYKGAKLLGGFSAENDALVVQFNLMTLPSLQSSIPISAYAIDQHTANNAIASNVDNHYMLRYGMLFASAFLQGFGTAYQNTYYCPPGTQYCNMYAGGNNSPPSYSATTETATYQGLGQVGTNLSQVAASQFNTPPTITVNQGTAIGVLFTTDVRIPLN